MPTQIRNSQTGIARPRFLVVTVVVALVAMALVALGINRDDSGSQHKDDRNTAASQARNPLGVGLGIGFPELPAAEFDRTLKMLQNNGCTWVRMGVRWDQMEKRQGRYDWTELDRMAAAMDRYDMNLLLNLNVSVPGWANDSSNERLVPADPSAYVAFARAVATHLPRQRFYEISNLPNTDGNWDPAPSATAYTDYLRRTYLAIKAVRPNSVILTGGLGYNEVGPRHPKNIPGSKFLEQMYRAGAKPYFDVVSFHAYWWPGHEPYGWGQLQAAIPVMEQNGDGTKPIWITEYGPPSADVGLDGQAKLLREQYEALAALPQVRNIMWHDLRDATKGAHLNNKSKITKGLLGPDFGLKPAWTAFTDITGGK